MKIPGWFWIVFATFILAGGILAGVIMLFVSWNHPSLTVDDDYYRRAVAYDEVKAQGTRNLELGWTLDLDAVRTMNAGVRETEVLLRLADGDGAALEQAEVDLEAFHLARAGERFHAKLSESGPGRYQATMPLRRVGLWEFRVTVRKDDDLFTATLEREF